MSASLAHRAKSPEQSVLIFSAIYLISLILAPLLASIRGWAPAALFFAVAAIYTVFGAVSVVQIQIALSQVQEPEPAIHDTYYLMSHGHFMRTTGIVMAILGTITWIQTRFGAMLYPTLTKILFWVLYIAVFGSTSFDTVIDFVLPTPRRYIDDPDFMQTYFQIKVWSALLSQVALIGLLCLLLWSIVAKWRKV